MFKTSKRILALVMVFLLMFGNVPTAVWAEGEPEQAQTEVAEPQQEPAEAPAPAPAPTEAPAPAPTEAPAPVEQAPAAPEAEPQPEAAPAPAPETPETPEQPEQPEAPESGNENVDEYTSTPEVPETEPEQEPAADGEAQAEEPAVEEAPAQESEPEIDNMALDNGVAPIAGSNWSVKMNLKKVTSGNQFEVGDKVTYELTVENDRLILTIQKLDLTVSGISGFETDNVQLPKDCSYTETKTNGITTGWHVTKLSTDEKVVITFTYTITEEDVANGETLKVTVASKTGLGETADVSNEVNIKLKKTKLTVDVYGGTTSVEYDGSNHTYGDYTVTVKNDKGVTLADDVVTVNPKKGYEASGTDADIYPFSLRGSTVSVKDSKVYELKDRDVTFHDGSLEITPREITVYVKPVDDVHVNAPGQVALKVESVDNLVNGHSVEFIGTGTVDTATAGEKAITGVGGTLEIKDGKGNDVTKNYDVTFAGTADVTYDAADFEATVTVAETSMYYGEQPEPSATVTRNGNEDFTAAYGPATYTYYKDEACTEPVPDDMLLNSKPYWHGTYYVQASWEAHEGLPALKSNVATFDITRTVLYFDAVKVVWAEDGNSAQFTATDCDDYNGLYGLEYDDQLDIGTFTLTGEGAMSDAYSLGVNVNTGKDEFTGLTQSNTKFTYTGTIDQVQVKDASGKIVTDNYVIAGSLNLVLYDATITQDDLVYGQSINSEVVDSELECNKQYNQHIIEKFPPMLHDFADFTRELTYYEINEDGTETALPGEPKDVGHYKVEATWTPNDDSYVRKFTREDDFRITPKELTVKADDAEKTYGTADPAFTATVTGWAYDDTAESTGLAYTLSHNDGENVGSHVIEASGSNDLKNYTVKYENGTLTITPAAANVGNLDDVTYNGQEQKQKPTVTGVGSTPLVEGTDYDLSYTEDCTNVGVVTVTVTFKGNYTGTVTRTYHINPAEVTVTPVDASKVYGTDDPDLSATVEGLIGGDTITYSLTREEGENVGTYDITASGAEDQGNYTVKYEDGTDKFTITPAALTIGITGDHGTYTYNGSDQSVEGFTTSELPAGVTVALAEGKEAKASRTDVGTTYMGLTKDDFVVSGADNYTVTVTIKEDGYVEITKADVTITIKGQTTDNEFTYDGESHTVDQFTVEGMPADVDFTVERTGDITVTETNANTYPQVITAEKFTVSESNNYNVTVKYEDGSLTVNKADVTIKPVDKSKVYDGKELTADEYEVVEGKGQFYGNDAGNYDFTYGGSQTEKGESASTVTAKLKRGEPDNYNIYTENGKLTITEKSIEPSDPADPEKDVEINSPSNEVYDGTEHKWAPTVIDPETAETLEKDKDYTVKYTNANGDEVTDFTNVTGEITVTITGTGNYSGTVTRTYEITPASVTIKPVDETKVYDGTELTASEYEVTSGEFYGSDADNYNFTYTGSQTVKGESGSTVTATLKDGEHDNYIINTEEGKLTVTAAEATEAQVGELGSVQYNGESQEQKPEVTDRFTNAPLAEGADYELSYTEDTTNVGEVTVTVTFTGNFTGTVTRTYEITPAPLSVNDPENSIYDGEEHKWLPTVTGVNDATLAENTDYTVKYARGNDETDDFTNVGEITVTVEGKGNYEGTEERTYSIMPAALAMNDATDSVYDGNAHQWAPSVTGVNGAALTAGTDYTVSYSTEDFTNVTGTITVTVTGTGNYSGTVIRTYEITPAPVTVTTGSATRVYNGAALTAGGTITGLVGNETATVTMTSTITNVGTEPNDDYVINWGTARANNYTVNPGAMGTLTVDPAALTVNTNGAMRAYNGQPLTASGSIDGLVNGETATVTMTSSITDAGSIRNGAYTIEWVTANEDNYEVVEGNIGTLTVNPRTVTVTSGSSMRAYNGQPLTASGTITGLVNGETATVNMTSSITDAGSVANDQYTITWGSADEDNYSVAEGAMGTLTINPRALTLTSGSASKEYDGTAVTADDVTVTSGSFVAGEGATYNVTGHRIIEGSSRNMFSYTLNANTDPANYNITQAYGTLTITAAPEVVPDEPEDPTVNIEDNNTPLGDQPDGMNAEDYTIDEEVSISENQTPLGGAPMGMGQECCILHFLLMLCALAVTIYFTHDRKKRQKKEFELRSELQ